MRLWHYKMIPHLPQAQLLGQHRECCALRGNGWGRKHSTVDYVFTHSPGYLVFYHLKVMEELRKRGVKVDTKWYFSNYRGQNCDKYKPSEYDKFEFRNYPEHDTVYLAECILNLLGKNKVLNPVLGCYENYEN